MPISRRTLSSAGDVYGRVFVGKAEYTAQIVVDVTALDDTVIDDDGYIKPGTALKAAGGLADGTANEEIFGIVPEPIKVADGNEAADLAAAATDFPLAVVTIAQINRAIAEDNLGRAYTANELAAFGRSATLKLLA